jgi:hypothetical protein
VSRHTAMRFRRRMYVKDVLLNRASAGSSWWARVTDVAKCRCWSAARSDCVGDRRGGRKWTRDDSVASVSRHRSSLALTDDGCCYRVSRGRQPVASVKRSWLTGSVSSQTL